ncbi:MAG TPA: hypothetical protein VM778_02445 [Gemmatimonadota bacterium]|nr:hypothetical protein [Gemmatimonadota bacterium]
MMRIWFPSTLFLAAVAVAPAAGQEAPPQEEAPRTFERRYVDAGDRRSNPVLLRDWPELSRLVAWSHGIEAAVAGESETLASELVGAFRARIDSLEAAPLPPFMAESADSIRAAFDEIRIRLDAADAALAAPSTRISFMGGAARNAPERQRTLVTGETAVTVPAGVAVGETDSLPAAEVGPAPAGSFLDHLSGALAGIDRLVHLTRGARRTEGGESSGPPGGSGSAPSTGTAPRPPGP